MQKLYEQIALGLTRGLTLSRENLQREEGLEGQICFTTPLINGLDGRKMSKSYGNTIGLTDSAKDMFGKSMRIQDEAMRDYMKQPPIPPSDWPVSGPGFGIGIGSTGNYGGE